MGRLWVYLVDSGSSLEYFEVPGGDFEQEGSNWDRFVLELAVYGNLGTFGMDRQYF